MSQKNFASKPLIRYVNRQQMSWRAVDVEKLIEEGHSARAIWSLVGRLDLRRFYEAIESSVEEGGRPAFDPQLLISLWVYAYPHAPNPVHTGHTRLCLAKSLLFRSGRS